MAQVSPKALEEFKKIYKEKCGQELSDKDAHEYAHRLLGFFEILYKVANEDAIRHKRLKEEPNGFPLENYNHYTCLICHTTLPGDQLWWDKYGIKCLDCQRNLEKGVVPKIVCKSRDSWYEAWEIKDKFGIHPSTLRKMVREGKIKARKLTTKDGVTYHEIFMIKENPIFSSTQTQNTKKS